jgi:hypothetical protein
VTVSDTRTPAADESGRALRHLPEEGGHLVHQHVARGRLRRDPRPDEHREEGEMAEVTPSKHTERDDARRSMRAPICRPERAGNTPGVRTWR